MSEQEVQQLEVELAKTRRALIAATTTLEDYQATTAAQREQIAAMSKQLEKERERGDMWYNSYFDLKKKEDESGNA